MIARVMMASVATAYPVVLVAGRQYAPLCIIWLLQEGKQNESAEVLLR
jgi:hypothetical protein